jgi:hypothetical protein
LSQHLGPRERRAPQTVLFERFRADPEAFAMSHVFKIRDFGGRRVDANLVEMVLDPLGDPHTARGLRQEDIPVVSVRERRDSDPAVAAFLAYWLPYLPDSTQSLVLGDAADFMFTVTMSGCSLGFGMPNPEGDLRVAHADSAQVGLEEDRRSGRITKAARRQARAQEAALLQTFPSQPTILRPADDRADPSAEFLIREQHTRRENAALGNDLDIVEAVVFGHRVAGANPAGKWRLYVQRFLPLPSHDRDNVRYLRDVTRIR